MNYLCTLPPSDYDYTLPLGEEWFSGLVLAYSPSVHIAVWGVQWGRSWNGTWGCWNSLGHRGNAEGTAGCHGARVTIDLLWRGERSCNDVWWICNRKGHLKAQYKYPWISCCPHGMANHPLQSVPIYIVNPWLQAVETLYTVCINSRQTFSLHVNTLFFLSLIILSFCKYPFQRISIYSLFLWSS